MKTSSKNDEKRREQSLALHFSEPNKQVDAAIDGLIEMVGGIRHVEKVRELILTALKAGQENSEPADLKLMVSSLKEMRYTAKIFGQYRQARKVSLFGSSRVQPDAMSFCMAKELGRKLAKAGYMLITGGGAGIMQAGNEGAGAENSFGISIRLPFESGPNAVIEGSPRSVSYKYFFNRKVAFVKEADAVVLFPGGYGTLDEAMEVLTLVQTGKRYPIPIILVDTPQGTYWSNWKRYVENEIAHQDYIGPHDLGLFDMVCSVDETIHLIDRFYRKYHSLRFVENKLVMRLNSGVDPESVRQWQDQFEDILEPSGGIALSGALAEEADEPQIGHLPRLVMDFNRRDYARLRQLIDKINET